jgi:arginyl-tRNA synthetase
MENPKEKIYSILQKIALEMGVGEVNFLVEKPKGASHGDFSANIALTVSSSRYQVLGIKSPLELAKKKASDNPVFYVQYAYSRICSIFKKAPSSELKMKRTYRFSQL